MGDGFIDIILFAMIAGFLVLRLRSVLGRRTGNERPPPDHIGRRPPREAEPDDNVIELPDHTKDSKEDAPFGPEPTAEASSDPVAAGLTQIQLADRAFTPNEFIAGASAAFEMVVEAFAKGDTGALRNLLNDEVLENFASAIEERKSAGRTLETTLVGIKNTDIIDARLDGRVAFITVKFVSDQINVTRDADGKVVEGSPGSVATVTDIWTFARNTRARDPNWTLVETRSPN